MWFLENSNDITLFEWWFKYFFVFVKISHSTTNDPADKAIVLLSGWISQCYENPLTWSNDNSIAINNKF